MAKFELKLPRMGESVAEATLTSWLVEVGDRIEMDDGVLEVSTDKVDTEIPSEVAGVLVEKLFNIDDVIKVGQTMAIIETDAAETESDQTLVTQVEETITPIQDAITSVEETIAKIAATEEPSVPLGSSERFYSPLIRSIAQKEQISLEELNKIPGTGKDDRLTKDDMLAYLKQRISGDTEQIEAITKSQEKTVQIAKEVTQPVESSVQSQSGDEIIPMDRMGKIIADHMVNSVQTSAHVQSFIEVDVTKIVNWRNKVKDRYLKEKGEKLTFTPIFMQAVAQCITEYPMVNISVDGANIIKKNTINLGMATALPDGNLIVPVIKNADELSLYGMVKAVNNLASKARDGRLDPDDIQGGTYTVTNVGSFGSTTGTPIINQPQVAILALGAIRKMPAVIESPEGDTIGIRQKMIIAHSYDHRVVNGALGGQFILKLKEILESFYSEQAI